MLDQSNRKPIVLTEDLIDEWVKRTGKDRALLEEMLKLHHKYIDHIIDTEPTALILSLPNFGSLRFNYYMAKNYLKGHTRTAKINAPIGEKIDKFRELADNKEGDKLKNRNRPLLLKQYYKLTGKTYIAFYQRFYELVRLLEEYHNNFYSSKQKGSPNYGTKLNDWIPQEIIEDKKYDN